MLDTTKIRDSIHAHRKRAGLTQRKLGELARIGISNISSYENGKIPCLYNAIAIADALRVSLDDLIGRVVMDCPTLTPPNEPLALELAVAALRAGGTDTNVPTINMTNADRIRAMSDDELANMFAEFAEENPSDDANAWYEWLQKPAEGL